MFRLLDALSTATVAVKSYILLYREETRRAASAHNQSTVTCRVPQEILATCFYFLPIRELVRATHVCRAWRETALAFPMLWSFIELDRSHIPLWYESEPPLLDRLLATVLARAKDRPVSLMFSSALPPAVLSPILAAHMHHLSVFSWTSRDSISGLVHPAPLLELAIFDRLYSIPADLFGGSAPRLRVLLLDSHLFLPVECPALENLTVLDTEGSFHTEEQAQSFSRIFLLMPRLETLALSYLSPETHRCLPAGPGPHTLERVMLWTEEDCDLVATVQAWRRPQRHFKQVMLGFELEFWRSVDLRILFDDAAVLTISWTLYHVELNMVAVRGEERGLELAACADSESDVDALRELLRQHLPHLCRVHTLRAPTWALSAELLNAMPALAHLTVIVDKWTTVNITIEAGVINRTPVPHFDCTGLAACLAYIPTVASLRVHGVIWDDLTHPTELTLSDLDSVSSALARSLPRRVAANATVPEETALTVLVTGFPPALVENFTLPSVPGYCIAFGACEDSDSDDA